MLYWKIQVRSNVSGQIFEDIVPAGSQSEASAMAKARYPGWRLYNPPSRVSNPQTPKQFKPLNQ